MHYVIFWGVLFVALTIVEIETVQLVSIWLAISALITMFVALAEYNLITQIVVFIVLNVILLLLTRPLARKLINTKTVHTNYERDLGKPCVVIEKINNSISTGRVTLDGVDWTARAFDDSIIDEDTVVYVEKIDGSKLLVRAK